MISAPEGHGAEAHPGVCVRALLPLRWSPCSRNRQGFPATEGVEHLWPSTNMQVPPGGLGRSLGGDGTGAETEG